MNHKEGALIHKISLATILLLVVLLAGFPGYVRETQNTTVAAAPPSEPDPFIDELAKDTFNYLTSDWATSNHLPWSWRSATIVGGDFANPAEIGLYALAWVAAYDWQRPWSPAWSETEAEVTAVLDQLRAWQTGSQAEQPHGPNAYNSSVFYQWYWVDWSPPVVSANTADHLVPSIDNAWLAASLLTIHAYAEYGQHAALAQKTNALLADMNFRLWWHEDSYYFTFGGVEDPQAGTLGDHYSNENRIVNFMARALKQISQEEFKNSLTVLAAPSETYNGITVEKTAWDGSYFTYTAPALFIREIPLAYGQNTIEPATAAQIAYAQTQGYDVWGLSDTFDVDDGLYLQQGAPPVAMPDPPESRPGLVTPHASALAFITAYQPQAAANLQAIANAYPCAYDPDFGFRESVMTNPLDTDFGQCSARFSSLSQLWLFHGLINSETDFIWTYISRDSGVWDAYIEMYELPQLYLPAIPKEPDN